MTEQSVFDSISADLSAGRTDGLTARILMISESTDDSYELLKCMSLLKLLPNDGTESRIANKLVAVTKEQDRYQVSSALLSLDCPLFALDLLDGSGQEDKVTRLRCQCLMALEEYESAMDAYSRISEPCIRDRIMLSSIQSSVGEHTSAIDTATNLLNEMPDDYEVRIAYVNALMMGGRTKDLQKYVRDGLKDKSADSNAVAAYVLRIQGNTKAAAGYATRAIRINDEHIGAMETLGICFASVGEYEKAKIMASAINGVSPGDKAAINILSYCEGH